MKTKSLLITAICVTALAATSFAQSKKASPSPSASASPAATASGKSGSSNSGSSATGRAIPFHGTASAVDQSGKTFTIAGKSSSRVFKLTDTTTVTKNGSTASLSDLTD